MEYCYIPIKSVFSDLFLVFEKNKNATEPISFILKVWFSNTQLTNNNKEYNFNCEQKIELL